jgi:membrane fusion protein (multidrug efflux system)
LETTPARRKRVCLFNSISSLDLLLATSHLGVWAMNPVVFAMRRPITSLLLVAALVSGGILGLSKIGADKFPAISTPKVHAYLDEIGKRAKQAKGYIVEKWESFFQKHDEEHEEEPRKVVATSPKVMDVTISQQYVCQIHSQRHIDIRALDNGYLEPITIREGQVVKKDDVLFKIKPVLYQTKAEAEKAEARLAQYEYEFTEQLVEKQAVSEKQALLYKARRDRAKANADKAQAELDFTDVRAPFDGIIDTLHEQQGSLIKEGDILTTLSDNSKMWVYFNVPERAYLEYMASKRDKDEQKIELELANHAKFPQKCEQVIVEAQFNNETGNIPFRADFPNPPMTPGEQDRLLRHGQTGTIWIHRTLKDALVIPQRSTFELLDKRYVWVIKEDGKAKQTLITIKHELEDRFVVNSGLDVNDKIVLEGVREVHEGGKVEYEFRKPEEALSNQKFHAE